MINNNWLTCGTGQRRRCLSKRMREQTERNYRNNRELAETVPMMPVQGQEHAPFAQMRYGRYPLSWNGCGVIAFYNLLCWQKRNYPLPEIIWEFEQNRMCWLVPSGLFGTNPFHLRRPLTAMGLPYSMTRSKRRFLEAAAEGRMTCGIIAYWNYRKSAHPFNFFGGGAHIVAFRFSGENWEVYNMYGHDTAPRVFQSLAELLRDRRMAVAYWLLSTDHTETQ